MKKLFIILLLTFSNLAVSADNLLYDGDLVRVSVYGNPDLTTEAKISAAGMLNFPLIGELKVGGVSAPEAEQLISKRLIKEGFLKRAQVNLIVLQSSSQQVSILGQVMKPGKYSIEPGAKTLFDFIAISGGVSAKGSDVITIVRMGDSPSKRITVNIDELFLTADEQKINDANILMNANDVIYVPEAPVFYVYGQANRPGVYRYKSGMTVAQAISAGGGISTRGSERGIEISRRNSDGKLEHIDASLADTISANDLITIEESLF